MTSFDPYFEQYGQEFGVAPGKLSNVARLESSYDPTVMNTWDSNAQAGIPSGGLFQFIEPTYTGMLGEAQQDRPDIFSQWSAGDWMDPEAQTALASWAFSQGKGDHWTTFDRAGDTAGASTAVAGTPTQGKPKAKVSSGRLAAFSGNPRLQSIMKGRLERKAQREALSRASSVNRSGYTNANAQASGRDWAWLQKHGANQFGLVNDPGTGQTTAVRPYDSHHNVGKALDWGTAKNTMDQLNQAAAYYEKQPWVEQVLWQSPGHEDHLHVGLA